MASSVKGLLSYYENRQDYYHYMVGGTIYTSLDTATTRNILTTIFVLLNLSIEFVGAFFLKMHNLRRLDKDSGKNTVPINHLTSWLSLPGTLRYFWDTFKFPGGIYGLAMLLAGVFALAHQYFVNSFILPELMQTTCDFNFGIVTTYLTPGEPLVPVSQWSAATTVYNAQLAVWYNGGSFGIYDKVNFTSVTFAPTANDTLGYWNCTYETNSTIYSTDWADLASLQSFLDRQDFLFTEAYYLAGSTAANSSILEGFLAWSANQPDDSLKQWAVRASIATNLIDSIATVTNLQCQLILTQSSWTPPVMPSNQTLREWDEKTYGFIMNAESADLGYCVEWILNAMVMVAGSGNSDQRYQLPAGVSRDFGCSVQGTQIRPQIWAILGAVILIFVPMLLAVIYLFVSQLFKGKKSHHPNLAKDAPNSVQDWQLALLRKWVGDEGIKARQMKEYSLRKDGGGKPVLAKNESFPGILLCPLPLSAYVLILYFQQLTLPISLNEYLLGGFAYKS
jgi:hypothetical protein